MGDDGVGPAVVDELRRRGTSERTQLIDAGLAFSEVLCDIEPDKPLVIVDAVRGGGEPGSVYRLSLSDLTADADSMVQAVSLHEISVLPALRMEALGGRKFADVTIFGVEPGLIAWGLGLSDPVEEAKQRVVQQLLRYVDEPAARAVDAACGSQNQ